MFRLVAKFYHLLYLLNTQEAADIVGSLLNVLINNFDAISVCELALKVCYFSLYVYSLNTKKC